MVERKAFSVIRRVGKMIRRRWRVPDGGTASCE